MVIQEYQNPSIKKWLKIGFWYQEHKERIVKLIIGALIAVNAAFWAYAFYGISKIVADSKNDELLFAELIKQRSPVFDIHQAQSPDQLVVSDIFAVPSSSETSSYQGRAARADIVAIVENPNSQWVMDVSYFFSWQGGFTKENTAQVLPGRKAGLAVFGAPVDGLPSDINIETRVDWKRIKDFSKLERALAAHDSLAAHDTNITHKDGITDVRVVVENQGTFTVIEPVFFILLSRFGSKFEAAGLFQAEAIGPKETITIEKRWLRALPLNSQIVVYPQADFLDDSTYKIPSAGDLRF